jgi:hypothetical protein
MNRLVAVDPPLDGAVVLLEHVVQNMAPADCRQSSARAPWALSGATAGGYAAWPLVLITRGAGWFAPPSAFARKRLALMISMLVRGANDVSDDRSNHNE